jgi:hypothetical protein
MAKSQNGWTIDVDGDRQDRGPIEGVEFPNGVLAGDVAVIFRHLVGRLSREVERIIPGTCWGWYVKTIEGSATLSNHGSGTAIDYNATRHPMGVRNTYSRGQQATIRAILADLDGVVRWGGDYTGRPDDMHFEIVKGAAAVAALASKIRGDLPMDQKTFNKLMNGWAATAEGKQAFAAAAAKAVWAEKVDIERAPGADPNLATFGAILSNVPAEHGGIRQAVDAHAEAPAAPKK